MTNNTMREATFIFVDFNDLDHTLAHYIDINCIVLETNMRGQYEVCVDNKDLDDCIKAANIDSLDHIGFGIAINDTLHRVSQVRTGLFWTVLVARSLKADVTWHALNEGYQRLDELSRFISNRKPYKVNTVPHDGSILDLDGPPIIYLNEEGNLVFSPKFKA